jgi:hypothetical protein
VSTLADTCDELVQALEHEHTELRDWWTMSRYLRVLVRLGERQRADARGYAKRQDIGVESFRSTLRDLERFAELKARVEEVIGG